MYHSEIKTEVHKKTPVVALLGNPNCGKSSIFNQLSGLKQKVGNFPGVTVDKKIGKIKLSEELEAEVIDFPGTYSLYPTSKDEKIVVRNLCALEESTLPDLIVYVADTTQLEKHLLLFTQILDLKLPTILALNMTDVVAENQWTIDTQVLAKKFNVPVIQVSGKTSAGIAALKMRIAQLLNTKKIPHEQKEFFYRCSEIENNLVSEIQSLYPSLNAYQALLVAHHHDWLKKVGKKERQKIKEAIDKYGFTSLRLQIRETMQRFDKFVPIAKKAVVQSTDMHDQKITDIIDRIVTHKVLGPIIFFLIMLFVFQSIFAWASAPMEWIESGFAFLSEGTRNILPAGWLSDLVVDGVLAGIGGVMVFIPQIAILFFLISVLEELGYMARAVSMFDFLMQRFGMNGRSIVALVSGGACAIPAIMSTRTISNWKERLITILVTPFISCSARIPVYTVLIAFVVPSGTLWGVFNYQGLAFMGLYLLGIIAALITALIFKLLIKSAEPSYLMMELPIYRRPSLRNVFFTAYEKVKTFVIEAGKIIFVISILLWVLASFGPGNSMQNAEANAIEIAAQRGLDEKETIDLIASRQVEASYAGILGKTIEPVIKPLGFDWKIGIALISSFAAREVFVGTMATIYSIGSKEDESSIHERMAKEIDPDTGLPVYSFATSLSLILFYVFAMQCMSTLAVVARETKGWKWPIIQFTFMTALAYLSSLIVYQWLT
jgi:ferrous iron transport protein B